MQNLHLRISQIMSQIITCVNWSTDLVGCEQRGEIPYLNNGDGQLSLRPRRES